MRITNGSFSRSVRQCWWTPESPHLHRVQASVRCRYVSDMTKGEHNSTFHYSLNRTTKYFTGCAGTEQSSSASVSGIARSVSNSIRTDTFTNRLRSDNSKQKIYNIINTTHSFGGCNTFTNVTDPSAGYACLHSLTTPTYVPPSRTSCTKGAFLHSSDAKLYTGAVGSALGRLAVNRSSRCARATEFPIDETDGNSVGNRKCETYPDPALPAFKHSSCVLHVRNERLGEQKLLDAHEQVESVSIASGKLHWISKHYTSKRTVASSTSCCPHVSVRSRIRPSHIQNDSTASKDSLYRDISTQTCNWLLEPRERLHVSLPLTFFATRSFFLGRKTTKARSDIASNSCGSAALSGGGSISADEERQTSSIVSGQRGGNGIGDMTQSTRHASTSSRESSNPLDAEKKPLSADVVRQNHGISQLKVAEDERILEKQKTPSGLRFFSPSKEDTKTKEDALPRAKWTASGKDNVVLKSPKVPLSKKLSSFIFGFFFASGCSFFIMYCQVADATLVLQQTAKDATHRLAVLESRMLELEKRARNC